MSAEYAHAKSPAPPRLADLKKAKARKAPEVSKAPKEGFELRDWQTKAIQEIESALASHKRVLLTAPTGAGKTEVYAAVIGLRVRKGGRIIVIAHTRNLTGQLGERFEKRLPKNARITVGNANDPTTWNRTADGKEIHVQVWTIQGLTSAIRRGLEIPQVSMVVFDEAHRSEAKSYGQVSEYFAHAQVFGATATPERTDRKRLPYDFMVRGPSTREACEQGIILPPKVYAPERGLVPDMVGVSLSRGDFSQREVAKRVKDKVLVGGIVDEYLKRAPGTQTIVFSVDVEHSKMICAQFNAAGISARHVDGTTDSDEAAETIRAFTASEFTVLCNCAMFMEGTDIRGVQTVILARPTCSRSIFMQTCGRGMRIEKGKRTPLVLDHAGNTYRHGHPVAYIAPDLDEVVPPYNRNALATVRRCKCGAMLEIGEACVCGEPEVPEIVNVEGELVEVKEEREAPTCFCCGAKGDASVAYTPSAINNRGGWPWMCVSAGISAAHFRKRSSAATFEEFKASYLERKMSTDGACFCGCGQSPDLSKTRSPSRMVGRGGWRWMCRSAAKTRDVYRKKFPEASYEEFVAWFSNEKASRARDCLSCGSTLHPRSQGLLTGRAPQTYCLTCSHNVKQFEENPMGCGTIGEYISAMRKCCGCGVKCSAPTWSNYRRRGARELWRCKSCRAKQSTHETKEAAQ